MDIALSSTAYTHPVAIHLLREGERFVARRQTPGGEEAVMGVAAMDGHGLSSDYGMSQGQHHYLQPEHSYINVRLDSREEGFYSWRKPNETLCERDGWEFFIEDSEPRAFAADPAIASVTESYLTEALAKKAKATAAYREAVKALEAAEAEVAFAQEMQRNFG